MPRSGSLEELRRSLERIPKATSTTPPTFQAIRVQSDSSGVISWTFSTPFAAAPIISCLAEGSADSIGAGYVPMDYAVITAVSSTSVTLLANHPNIWFHLTASGIV